MKALKSLYQDIHDCHVCPKMDPEKELRRIDAVAGSMDVFIISQALAENQIRKSGVNFFTSEGKLGSTGKNLEKFLNRIDRTVYPQSPVVLNNGGIIEQASSGLISVYNTDVTQCFPGKKSASSEDRPPTSEEMKTCISKGFFISEIEFIKPKLLLLMGNKARTCFYQHVIGKKRQDNLGEHIATIVENEKLPEWSTVSHRMYVVPIQHASSLNRAFTPMLKNSAFITLIYEALACC